MTDRRAEYQQYLMSETWRYKRLEVYYRDKGVCQAKIKGVVCGVRTKEVHHRRYPEKLGSEPVEWLMLCCRDCHKAIHAHHEDYSPAYYF